MLDASLEFYKINILQTHLTKERHRAADYAYKE